MKKKMNKKILDQFWLTVIFTSLLILIGIVLIFHQQSKIQVSSSPQTVNISKSDSKTLPSVTNYPNSINNKNGFHRYTLDNKWFDLDLPKECSIDYSSEQKVITCKTTSFTVIIYPQTGGRSATVKAKESITLNGITWIRTTLENDPQYSDTYEYDINGNTYLIGVNYQPYIKIAQNYVEKIISSFHFIN